MGEYRWEWLAVSSEYNLRSLVGTPSPPSKEELISHFINDGQVDTALGEFVRTMLDAGFTLTLSAYAVDCESELIKVWQFRDWTYARYKTHTRLTVYFDCDPEPVEARLDRPGLFAVTPALIVAIGRAIALIIVAVGVFYALQNLTTQKKTTERHYPDCTWETITEEGPPPWWENVLIFVGVSTIVVAGAIAWSILKPSR